MKKQIDRRRLIGGLLGLAACAALGFPSLSTSDTEYYDTTESIYNETDMSLSFEADADYETAASSYDSEYEFYPYAYTDFESYCFSDELPVVHLTSIVELRGEIPFSELFEETSQEEECRYSSYIARYDEAEPKASDQCLHALNHVRYKCAESNKFDGRFFRWKWQHNIRAKWHTIRQKTCDARANAINNSVNSNPDDWNAALDAVLGTVDSYEQAWGNCSEQSNSLAALVYNVHQPPIWVRICTLSGHAWVEVSRDTQSISYLDPWADAAGVVDGATPVDAAKKGCSKWYRRIVSPEDGGERWEER